MEKPSEGGLRRSLGLFDVTLFFVVATTNLQWIATAAAAGPSSLVVWVLGGVALFVPLAVAVLFLSSRFPVEGGMYVWTKRAFGPAAGFMVGWTYWTSAVIYFPALLYFMAGNALYFGGSAAQANQTYYILAALAGMTLATLLNVVGLDVGKWLNNIGALCRWAVILLVVALGTAAWWKFGSATTFSPEALRPGTQLKDVLFWSTIALAWSGLESIPFMGGEVVRPRRTIPLGLALAAPLIAAIYIAGTAGVLAAIPARDVNPLLGAMQAIAQTAKRLGLPGLAPLGAVLVTASCLGSVGVWTGSAARIPFVAGLDRYLPEAFGRLHPRWRTPVTALLTQFAFAAALIVAGQSGASVRGAYDTLVSATVITTLLPFLYLFASAVKLRNEPAATGEARIAGAPVVVVASTAGFVTTAVSIVLAAFPADDEPNKGLAVAKLLALTVLVLASGAALYLRGRRLGRVTAVAAGE